MHFFSDGFADFADFFSFLLFLQRHQNILGVIRIGNVAKDKTFFFGGGLNENIAIIEKSGNHAFHFGGDVLNIFQFQFADLAGEKSFLFNVYHARAGDDPNVQIIVNPNYKKYYPDKHGKRTFTKKEKPIIAGSFRYERKIARNKNQRTEKNDNHQKNNGHLFQNIKPMAVKKKQNHFPLSLSGEMKMRVAIEHISYSKIFINKKPQSMEEKSIRLGMSSPTETIMKSGSMTTLSSELTAYFSRW